MEPTMKKYIPATLRYANARKKRILFSMLINLLSLSLWAQEAHWQCNPYDFQYDMTAYVVLQSDDAVMTDLSNYEIAAFCGDECRGVAELMTAGESQIGYLRIRSNSSSGDKITFKVFDKVEEKEIDMTNAPVSFVNNDVIGMPSNPLILEFPKPYTLGDVNGDGEINAGDVSAIINNILRRTNSVFIEAAADMNGDGEINAGDVSAIINIILKRY